MDLWKTLIKACDIAEVQLGECLETEPRVCGKAFSCEVSSLFLLLQRSH